MQSWGRGLGEEMMKRNNFQGFAIATLSALIWLLLLVTPQPVRAALTATALGDYDNVTVMEVSGNYDAVDAYGQWDLSGRRTIAKALRRGQVLKVHFLRTGFPEDAVHLRSPHPPACSMDRTLEE